MARNSWSLYLDFLSAGITGMRHEPAWLAGQEDSSASSPLFSLASPACMWAPEQSVIPASLELCNAWRRGAWLMEGPSQSWEVWAGTTASSWKEELKVGVEGNSVWLGLCVLVTQAIGWGCSTLSVVLALQGALSLIKREGKQ